MSDFDKIYRHTEETIKACQKQIDAYHVVLQGIAKTGIKMGAVCLADAALGNKLVVRLSFGMEQSSNKILTPSTLGKLAAYEAFEKSKIIIADYNRKEYTKSDLELVHGIQKAIFVPIIDANSGSAIGVLMGECSAFSKDDERIALISKIATLLGSVISKLSKLTSETIDTQKEMMKLEASNKLPKAFQTCIDAKDIEELSDRVLEYCLEFTSSQFGFVGYIDQSTGFLICPTMTKDIFPACGVEGKTVIFEKAGGLGGYVLDHQKPLVANDPVSHPASVGTPPGHIPIRKFMGIPCLYQGKTVGMVALANKDSDYTESDLYLASSFATLYASCVAGFFSKENLQKSEHALKELYDNAPCGYFTMFADGEIQRCNATMRTLIGIEPKNINKHLSDNSKELLRNQILTLQENGAAQPLELDFMTNDGNLLHTIHSISGTKDERGYYQSFFCTVVDITELKIVEQKLNDLLLEANQNLTIKVEEAVREIRQKEKALVEQSRLAAMGEMIATIAHEWRQPLNAIALHIQDLREAFKYGELTEKYIEESTTKSMNIVKSMSNLIEEFSRLFNNTADQADHFSVTEAIDNAIGQLHLKNAMDEIIIERQECQDIYIKGRLSDFSQALFNILQNAKEAMDASKPEKPLIKISSMLKDGECLVEIENYGSNIPDEKLGKIFEPYYSTKAPASGVGLGLFITKIIIEKTLSGKIEVSNTQNGIKFSINLPANKQASMTINLANHFGVDN